MKKPISWEQGSDQAENCIDYRAGNPNIPKIEQHQAVENNRKLFKEIFESIEQREKQAYALSFEAFKRFAKCKNYCNLELEASSDLERGCKCGMIDAFNSMKDRSINPNTYSDKELTG